MVASCFKIVTWVFNQVYTLKKIYQHISLSYIDTFDYALNTLTVTLKVVQQI